MGESFLFSKTNESWKIKRKACAHAFYKDRLLLMMEVLKSKIEYHIDIWNEKIATSVLQAANDTKAFNVEHNYHIIDIAKVYDQIFSINMITIAFGEDITDDRFDFLVYEDDSRTFVTK
jgi:hypothetical protein